MAPDPSTGSIIGDPQTMLKAAKFFAAQGLWILPIKQGSKQPSAGMRWNDPESDRIARNTDDVDRLWGLGQEYCGHGVGVFCSQESRTIILDVDVKAKDGRKPFMALATKAGLPNTLQNDSPSGGFHRLYKVPAGWKPRSDKAPRFSVEGMDILFNRRQAVMAPTLYVGGGQYQLHYLEGGSGRQVQPLAELTIDQVDLVLYGSKFDGVSSGPRSESVRAALEGEWDANTDLRDSAAGALMDALSQWPMNRYGEVVVEAACAEIEGVGSGGRYNQLKRQVMRVVRAAVDENGSDGAAQINLSAAFEALFKSYHRAQSATGEWSGLEQSNFDDTLCWALTRHEVVFAARQKISAWKWAAGK